MTELLSARASLLGEVFPGTRLAHTDYLRWLYEAGPDGAVIATDFDDEQGLAGHYAVVPLELARLGGTSRAALSLNTAVHPRAQGGGVFVRLAEATYASAAQVGVEHVIGVANANSTPGFLRRLGFRSHGPLAVSVLVPTPGRRPGFSTRPAADAEALIAAGAPHLAAPTQTWSRRWTPTTLAWRLRAPGAHYAVHGADDVLAISTVERRGPVSIAILLGAFSARPLSARRTRQLIREICVTHRAPVALHAGTNEHLSLRGVPLPDRLRPSPLNLISRSLGHATELDDPTRFEFLDFDAY